MAKWIATITNAGTALLNSQVSGADLVIVGAVSSSTETAADELAKLTEMTNIKQDLTIGSASVDNTNSTFSIPVTLLNDDLEVSYALKQIGIYAQDPTDTENKILFAVAQIDVARVINLPADAPGYKLEIDLNFQNTNNSNVVIQVTDESLRSRVENLEDTVNNLDVSIEVYDSSNVNVGKLEKFDFIEDEFSYFQNSNITLQSSYYNCVVVVYKNEFHSLGSNHGTPYSSKHRKWNGTSWEDVSTMPAITNSWYQHVTVKDDYIYLAQTNGTIYRWTDETGEWETVITNSYSDIYCMFVHNNMIHIAGGSYIYRLKGTAMEVVTSNYTGVTGGISYGARCISYKNKIYVISRGTSNYNYMSVFNGTTWSNISSFPGHSKGYEYNYCGLAVYKNKLYIAGGQNSSYALNHFHCYDGSTFVSYQSLPEKLSGLSLCIHEDELYITGGFINSGTYSFKFYKYAPSKNSKIINKMYYKNNEGELESLNRIKVENVCSGSDNEGTGTSNIFGNNLVANSYQLVAGHYNNYNNYNNSTAGASSGTTGQAFIIGNGTSSARANAFRVSYGGAAYGLAEFNSSGADFAEFREWQDGNVDNEDRVGYFVTREGLKIRKANAGEYVAGITSGNPCLVGNSDESWRGRYILDDFGRFIEETFEYNEIKIDEKTGKEIISTKVGTKYKENPDYDPSKPYIERKDRQEWEYVGMKGELAVRDDGTCQVDGYCKVADGGIATSAEVSEYSYLTPIYRVVDRVTENIVKVEI